MYIPRHHLVVPDMHLFFFDVDYDRLLFHLRDGIRKHVLNVSAVIQIRTHLEKKIFCEH